MHAIIAKQAFVVIVAFCCNICLFTDPVLMILKVVGCERLCARERVASIGAWGRSPQLLGNSCNFFGKYHLDDILHVFRAIGNAKLLRFGRI